MFISFFFFHNKYPRTNIGATTNNNSSSQNYKLITLQEFQKEVTDDEKKKSAAKEVDKVRKEILKIKIKIDEKITEITGLKEELIELEKTTTA